MTYNYNTFKINTLLFGLLICFFGYAQHSKTKDTFNYLALNEKIYDLLKKDRIPEARYYLDNIKKEVDSSDINFKISFHLNNAFVFLSSSKYKRSEYHLLKGLALISSSNNNALEHEMQTLLLRVYKETNVHNKVDSLFGLLEQKKGLEKSGLIFFNYDDLIQSWISRKRYDAIIPLVKKIILEINTYDYEKVRHQRQSIIKKSIKSELQLFLTKALIETKQDYKYSLALLNKIEQDSLNFVKRERHFYLKEIYEYKARFYYEYQSNIDSVFKYKSLALSYNNSNIRKLQKRSEIANDYSYENKKKERNFKNLVKLNQKNTELNKSNLYVTLLIAVLLLFAIGFIIYVYTTNKKIKKYNTTLKAKNRLLTSIDKERAKFYAVISHELRTPIFTIKGLTEIISETTDLKIKEEYNKSLLLASNHLNSLVNNALEYSRQNFKKESLIKDTFSLKDMLLDIEHIFKFQFKNNTISYSTIFTEDIDPIVNTDRLKLSQVFINLISNAVKFAPNGIITLTVTQTASSKNTTTLLFTIADNGIGISKTKIAHIFDGLNDNKHVNETKGGAGLGLYIVKKILQDLYQTNIMVTSELNKGTSFSFELEMEKTEVPNAISIKNDKILEQELKKEVEILVVDDNKINLVITQKKLEKMGITCTVIDNGVDAIKLVRKQHYDMIFMDINMPEISGIDTTKNIRAFNTSVIIVALTASDKEASVDLIKKSGMNDIITKPYSDEEFVEKITRLLHS